MITDLSADGVRTATTTIALDGATHQRRDLVGGWPMVGVRRGAPAGGPDRRIVDEVVVDTEADDIRRLSGLTAIDFDWAPDATELAIASDGVVLYSVTADETRPLGGAGADSVAGRPTAERSPFTRISSGLNDSHHDLWLMDADGTNERILVPDIRAVRGLGQVWSPTASASPTNASVTISWRIPPHRAFSSTKSSVTASARRSTRTSRHPGGHPTTADHRTPRVDLVVSVECHMVARRHHTALLRLARGEHPTDDTRQRSRRSAAGRRDTTGRLVRRPFPRCVLRLPVADHPELGTTTRWLTPDT